MRFYLVCGQPCNRGAATGEQFVTSKRANRQTDKQASGQTSKRVNKQAGKQASGQAGVVELRGTVSIPRISISNYSGNLVTTVYRSNGSSVSALVILLRIVEQPFTKPHTCEVLPKPARSPSGTPRNGKSPP